MEAEKANRGPEHRYEYRHYDLGYGLHYGIHSLFGEHVAIGVGSNMVHLYPYKIVVGPDPADAVALTPAQQRVMRNMFRAMSRRIEAARVAPVTESGTVGGQAVPGEGVGGNGPT